MSNRNNDVYQVLIASSLATGTDVPDTLGNAQLGIFDANTNESLMTATDPVKEMYIAVGVGDDGAGGPNDIRTSAGQLIQTKNVVGYTFKPYNAGQSMIVKVGDYMPQCETDYTMRVEFRNSRIYRLQGFNQFSKAYSVRTACCDDCADDCNTADANELTKLLVNEVNLDTKGMLKATPIARQALTAATQGVSVDYAIGAVMTMEDVDVLIAYNKTLSDNTLKVYTDFQLEADSLKVGNAGSINLKYHKLLETAIIVSLVGGFGCSGGKVTTTRELIYSEGSGANIRQKEYHASAWNGAGPYVASDTTGTSMDNIEYLSDASANYDQIIIEYNQKSYSGWLEYENPLSTIIAIPAGDADAASLLTILETLTGIAVSP